MKRRIRELTATVLVICMMAGIVGIESYAEGETVTFEVNYPGGELSVKPANVTITDLNTDKITLTELTTTDDRYEFLGWYGYYYNQEYSYDYGKSGTIDAVNLFDPADNATTSTLTAGWVQRIQIDMLGTTNWYRVDKEIVIPEITGYLLDSWTLNDSTIQDGIISYDTDNCNVLLSKDATSINADNVNIVYTKWRPENGKLVQITNRTDDKTLSIDGVTIEASETGIIGPFSDTSFTINSDDEKYHIDIEIPENSLSEYASYEKIPANSTVEVYPVALSDNEIQRYLTVYYQDSNEGTEFKLNFEEYTGTWPVAIENIADTEASGVFRDGYTLMGWNYVLDKTGSVDSKYKLSEDTDDTTLTCTPVWGGTISFDAQYPEGNADKIFEDVVKKTGDSITLTKGLTDDTGKHVFLGWSTSPKATEPDYTDTYTVEGDTTLYGVWGPASYTLTWKDYSDGVDFESQTYSSEVLEYHSSIALPSDPEKEGYTFLGWNGYGSVYADGDMSGRYKKGDEFSYTMPAHDAEMSAYWQINSYKLNYDGNGTSTGVPAESEEIVYKNTATVSSIAPVRTGYTFSGWSDGTNIYKPGASFSMPARNVTLTAQWKPNRHNVTYDGDGATSGVPDSHEADYDSSVTAGSGPKRDGYVFSGWEQISTGNTINAGGTFLMPDMDETLKAKWQIAYSQMGKGTFYLVKGQNYSMDGTLKVSGDNSVYSSGITFYVPASGNYTFE